MEFPHLGQHCSNSSCKQLDFLPMKCDACSQTFCKDHIHYSTHSCEKAYQKDNQVPVCPLCNCPCPVKKGESPDVVVGRHIDTDCLSDPAKERRKVYTNKCSYKSCKQKELVPVKCESCHKNFCLRHRHEQDHKCQGFQGSGQKVSNSGAAAIFRSQQPGTSKPSSSSSGSSLSQKSPQQTSLTGLGRQLDQERRNRQAASVASRTDLMPGNMTEDEALRYAMQMSMTNAAGQGQVPQEPQPQRLTQEQEDLLLARALAASEEENVLRDSHRNMARPRRQEKSSCQLS